MKIPKALSFLVSNQAARLATVGSFIIGLVVLWPDSAFHCLVLEGGKPASQCYFFGPDGTEQQVSSTGRTTIPAHWRGKRVRIMDSRDDSLIDSFIADRPLDGVLEIRLPASDPSP